MYTGKIKAEKNPLTVLAFISFFPVVASGPIQRGGNLIPQLQTSTRFDYDAATGGMKLFAWGLFKKLCVADRIALYVDHVYADSGSASGTALLLAAFLYSFQIYCDFSGYSDMAIGTARFLGFDVGKNFDHPYLSRSVGEFWRRWHISLSSWLRDYVYIPLGGSRCVVPRIYLNLLITFLVSGMWHGSSLHFVVWGLFLGGIVCIERATKNLRGKLTGKGWNVFFVILTFILITIGWIFFRAESVSKALLILKRSLLFGSEIVQLFVNSKNRFEAVRSLLMIPGGDFGGIKGMALLVLLLAVFAGASFVTRKKDGLTLLKEIPVVLRWTLYVFLCLFILLFFVESTTKFIYTGF